jgi:membrane-bound lytic murein transglycosylase MltF
VRRFAMLVPLLIAIVLAAPMATAQSPHAPAQRKLDIANKPWTGDFDAMLERRMIRVYVPYSRSLYFVDKGRERGIAVELIRDLERWLNQRHAKALGKRPLTVYVVAATRDRLIPDLKDGLADLAVGNLTVTPERLAEVDFVAPDDRLVNREILVTGPSSPAVAAIDALAGKTVHVRKASSYHASLVALNVKLKSAGKAEANLVLVPDALEDEDMLEMLNAGLLQAIVVDDWKAKAWTQALSRIVVHENIVLREPTRRGSMIRKGSPLLSAELTAFYEGWAKKMGVIPYRTQQYIRSVKALGNSAGDAETQRYQSVIALFRKYGAQYGFDPVMLAAQGYQESTLDQKKRSRVGAIGVMQIMPATGAGLKVGDITQVEANIHGGAKYMGRLMTQYFKDANFTEQDRTLFAFASYNAGPGNIARMRKEAQKRGLDPDRWFNHVEVVTAEKIGIETTTYVRNIFKYYVSYTLAQEASAAAAALKQSVPATR